MGVAGAEVAVVAVVVGNLGAADTDGDVAGE